MRAAVIAVLLACPEYAEAVPAALERLQPLERLTLGCFYTAAMLLQQEYAGRLRQFVSSRWQWLSCVKHWRAGACLKARPVTG